MSLAGSDIRIVLSANLCPTFPILFPERKAKETSTDLSRTKAQLGRLEKEIRTLQAKIIAEQVGRNEVERDAQTRGEEVRQYRDELAGAVRALRRAKEETKKLDEERRKGMRLYEETRER